MTQPFSTGKLFLIIYFLTVKGWDLARPTIDQVNSSIPIRGSRLAYLYIKYELKTYEGLPLFALAPEDIHLEVLVWVVLDTAFRMKIPSY